MPGLSYDLQTSLERQEELQVRDQSKALVMKL